MIKEVLTDLEKLSERSEEITDIRKQGREVQQLVLNLKDTAEANKFNGLAAPQIGENKRIIVMGFDGKKGKIYKSFVNPVIDYPNVKGITLSTEESPVIPGKHYLMVRNNEVPLMYMTPLGQVMSTKFYGMAATVLQQMMNALDGVQLSDMGLEVDDDFINASEEEKAPIIEQYLRSLDIKQKAIEEEVNESAELSQIRDAGEFIGKVNAGEVNVVVSEEKLPEKVEEQ